MMLGWRARIGQMRPATAIEGAEEWRSVAPVGVAFADARTIVPRVDAAGLKVMMSQVDEAARQLATAKVDLIAQCGAPGTFLVGPHHDAEVVARIKELTGIPAITMMAAQMDALKALGAKNIAVATIYSTEVNDKMVECMEAHGFSVKAIKGLELTDPFEASLHDADTAYRLSRKVLKQAGKADAILISCGTFRTFEIIPYLEMDTGLPVVSSNQATLWSALRTLGLPDVIPNLGKLWTVA
ncbi:aspartate/glutamate racemase family protein [Glaciimonas sp. PCH181]|uniref:maleate cis-trans isomerase family protein n=1 Tax=Glaciimonas sp. PCH181 TaxID=2133943 RepID=UPI000D3C81E0|nr:aspartate/glutamate racemase family protein [Glaciimonas sp. PCH181]PUA18635.1 decarboxylase [Glaciimonas sp. PCH181]